MLIGQIVTMKESENIITLQNAEKKYSMNTIGLSDL